MKKFLPLFLVLFTVSLRPCSSRADGAAGPKVSGFVDGSYSYDFNNPGTGFTSLRSYDAKADTFRLDSAHVAISGSTDPDVSYDVEIDMGSDAQADNYAQLSNQTFNIQEAYATFKDPLMPKSWNISVKAGHFATLEGIEVIESGSNPTISRGYLYGLAECLFHSGVLFTKPAGKLSLSAGVINGWDSLLDNNSMKTGIGQIGISCGDKGFLNFQGSYGAEGSDPGISRTSYDMVGLYKSSKADLWIQANYGEEGPGGYFGKWGGAGLQPVLKFSDKWSLGLRAEYFEHVGYSPTLGSTGTLVSATNFTLTPTWNVKPGLVHRWELRYDSANGDIFSKKADMESSTVTASTEFLVSF